MAGRQASLLPGMRRANLVAYPANLSTAYRRTEPMLTMLSPLVQALANERPCHQIPFGGQNWLRRQCPLGLPHYRSPVAQGRTACMPTQRLTIRR